MGCFEKMIPQVKFLCDTDKYNNFGTGISGDFKGETEIFKAYLSKGLSINLTDGDDILVKKDTSLSENEYYISSKKDKITVRAGGSEGANYAFASLLQVMKRYESKPLVAEFEMHDKPDCAYRGIMIDCARNHHPISLLKKYVDMCWFYKIRCLHLHLSDDQAYTLPSEIYPKLTSHHNCFSREEIEELVEYAHGRAVQIVPEIDTPGHSSMIRRAYPDVFGSREVIGFTEKSINAVKELYGEVCDMFPYSEYIHMGADESELMDWNNCEESISYGLSLGINIDEFKQDGSQFWRRSERFLAHYINEVSSAIKAKGRKPIAWEGFHKDTDPYVTRDVTVMVFESLYQLAKDLRDAGFKIINCSWRPTYIVVPAWFWGKSDTYQWDIGSFSAVHPESPYYGGIFRFDSKENIEGGQLNAWGDTLSSLENGLEVEFERILEDAPAIAENTWNKTKRGDYKNFLSCDSHCVEIFRKIIQ